MSVKLCQGSHCHEYKTKDRIRGNKGNKHYQTRRRTRMYYGSGNFCSQNCYNDWAGTYIDRAIDYFGRLTEPKKVLCDDAWYKDYKYNYDNNSSTNYHHYLLNDLLGRKIPITEEQYNDANFNISSINE